MPDLAERFVQEFVVGFGFLSGLFIAIKVNPKSLLVESIIKALSEINPDAALLGTIFFVVGILTILLSIFMAYSIGGGDLDLLRLFADS